MFKQVISVTFLIGFLGLTANAQLNKNNVTVTAAAKHAMLLAKPTTYQITFTNNAALIKYTDTLPNTVAVVKNISNYQTLQIKTSNSKHVTLLANNPSILLVDVLAPATEEIGLIGYNRSIHNVGIVQKLYPQINGAGITVGVKERLMDKADIDIYKRVITSSIQATSLDQHANTIATIIAGAGNSNYDGKGLANAATIFPSSFANLFADDAAILNANNVTVQNHSYGTVTQQFYGAEAVSYDKLCWENPNMVSVFSSGNSGLLSAADGPYANIAGYANITGNFKMAKNVITVAGVNQIYGLSANSSNGPCYDGRVAPQLAALGPNGTSDAAAMVSGTAVLLQQLYKQQTGALPTAALTKALMFCTATDIGPVGIDYKTGYGLLNPYKALQTAAARQYFLGAVANSQTQNFTINIVSNAANISVAMCYTDSQAMVNNTKALINNLNVELVHVASGTIYKPWVLSKTPNKDSLTKESQRGVDTLNTTELISIKLPMPGAYNIKVTGSNVPVGNMPFAIAYSVDTLNTFSFINPITAEDINPSEMSEVAIKWQTAAADTNTVGSLQVTYDNGTSFTTIADNYKLYKGIYYWPIPNLQTTAAFKMVTPFGSFLSDRVVIHRQIATEVNFNCADSFRLSWSQHANASGYQVLALVDSPYLRPIATVTDTFKVFNKNIFPYTTYAVNPILQNGLQATRGFAVDINTQGVNCFYTNFYFDLLDDNFAKLILNLSPPNIYVDSIYFEELNQAGIVIQQISAQKVTTNGLTFTALTNALTAGKHFFRARIKTKSAGFLYTDITAVLVTGTDLVRMYPNPAPKNGQINILVKQGQTTDKTIQFFNSQGQYIKGYSSIPEKISAALFPSGIIFYKITENGKLLYSNKILINK
jgi:hypothetical protein